MAKIFNKNKIIENAVSWVQQGLTIIDKQENKSSIAVVTGVTTLLVYLGVVRYLRYRYLNSIKRKYPNPKEVLENEDAAQEIFARTTQLEFPFLGRQGTELALFKTYTIPTISKILAATGQFVKDCPRRIEDTELLLHEMVDTYGRIQAQLAQDPKTPKKDIDEQWQRPKDAVNRLNEIHGKYNILNDDFLYTLSLFVFEPISWINRYGFRKLDERETNAMFKIWYDIGVKMKLKDIPDTPQKMYDFKTKYAKEAIGYSPHNWTGCGEPTVRDLMSKKLPTFLRERGYQFILQLLPSILDPVDAAAFQLPYPESKLLTSIVKSTLAISAFAIRYFMLPRTKYTSRTPFYANDKNRLVPTFFMCEPAIYKDGYVISELGPVNFNKNHGIKDKNELSCPFNKN